MENWEVIYLVSALGFAGAILFGLVASKTQFCIMGSISDWINMGSKVRFRAWVLSMGVAIIGSQIMYQLGWVDLGQSIYLSSNLRLLGFIVGGFIFGIGMTLGSGCGQRTLVRVGGGNLKSLVVLIVLAVSAYATLRGILAIIRIEIFDALAIDLTAFDISSQGIDHILARFTGVSIDLLSLLVAAVLGLGAIWYAFKDSEFRKNFDNILAGLIIGLLVVGAWYVTGVIGNDDFEPVPLESLTFIAPAANALNYLMTWTGSQISFGIAVVFGMILGSFIYAIVSGNFRIESFSSASDMRNHMVAGILMGFGGVLSLGCTIGQGVSGISTLAIGSLITIAAIMFGSALTIKVQYHMIDEGFWWSLKQSLIELKVIPSLMKR